MPYQKKYRTIVPIEEGTDVAVARWLTRESFERTAAGDCLQIVEYTERELAIEDIPPIALVQLGRPLTDYRWFEFCGVGQLDKELFDWLSAEIVWKNEQLKQWLHAEKVYAQQVRVWLKAEKQASAELVG